MPSARALAISPFHNDGISSYSSASFALNSTSAYISFTFKAFEATTINQLGMRFQSKVGTSPSYIIGLEGVSLTTGLPTGVYKQTGGQDVKEIFNPGQSGWANNTFQWVTMDPTYTCTQGELLALTIRYSSGTIDASNYVNITTFQGDSARWGFPMVTHSGTKQISPSYPMLGYASSTVSYGYPIQGQSSVLFDDGTTPDEVGWAINLPSDLMTSYKIAGLRCMLNPGTSGAIINVRLYEGTTVIQDISGGFDTDLLNGAFARYQDFFFDGTLATLTAGTTYRLALKRTDVGTDATLYYVTLARAQDRSAFPWGESFAYASRVNDGAWNADDQTIIPFIDLILQDITIPSGGVVDTMQPIIVPPYKAVGYH